MTMKWTGPLGANNKKHHLILAILTLVIVFAVIGILCARPVISSQEPVAYTVRKGDTLWDICRAHYGNTCDVREMVWWVRQLNNIEDPGRLQPGVKIYLPIRVD